MSQQISGAPHIMNGVHPGSQRGILRVNRLPVVLTIGIGLVVVAVIIFGLSSRGYFGSGRPDVADGDRGPASNFAENLKRGVGDGIITETAPSLPPPATQPPPPEPSVVPAVVAAPRLAEATEALAAEPAEATDTWRERLQRVQEEEILNERHRQVMARLQRAEGARTAPLRIDQSNIEDKEMSKGPATERDGKGSEEGEDRLSTRLIEAARSMGIEDAGFSDANGQGRKQAFLDQGRGPSAAMSRPDEATARLTLKRGSVIPAMLLTGINSDLPGRILAQVSRNVYDSVTGRQLLIPQGARLLGRYDAKVSFGQSRVLVVWTDLILADGRSLDIGSMAGTDATGQAGFSDRVDRHLARTFGSAALIALIGTGMDLTLPESSSGTTVDAFDAARRSFSETFGRLAERTISKNLDVQPTLTIRPGYRFNILVDQDLVFG
jgi:type IV secretion system protein VirB10